MVRTSKAGDQDAELAIIVHSAMALVIVGHRAGSTLLHRQARLGDSPALADRLHLPEGDRLGLVLLVDGS
jgi:hypothetical protein